MAIEFEKLQFTKNWNSSADFPTYEEDEQKVRADLQALHDETKEFINEKLIPAVQNMAVPGAGDMRMAVYDPLGKGKDIYQYAKDKIAEHLNEASHVDAYSKDEVLSAETRTALNLAADATPDAALGKIAATPDIVTDAETGKKYTVKAAVKGFGVIPVPQFTGVAPAGGRRLRKWGNKIAVCLRSKLSGDCGTNITVRDLDTQTDLVTVSTSYASASGGTIYDNKIQATTDGAILVAYQNGSLNSVLDLKHDKYYKSMDADWNYYTTDNYIGGANIASNTSRKLYYYVRGNDTENTLSLGSGQGGGYYNLTMIGAKGDVLWMIEPSSDTQWKLMKVDIPATAVTAGLVVFTAPSAWTKVAMTPVLATDDKAYIRVTCTISSVGYVVPKLLEVNLSTGETNWDALTGYEVADLEVLTESLLASVDSTCYFGSVGDDAYFVNGTTVAVFNKPGGTVSAYSIPVGVTGVCQGNTKEVLFAIPELPGVIICGTLMLDTVKGELSGISGGKIVTLTDSLYSQTEAVSQYGIGFAGTVEDTKVAGMYNENYLIGGDVVWDVASLEEYTETEEDVPEDTGTEE